MSGLLTEIGSILYSAQRSIAGVIPDCAVREQHSDELEITQHPVETGSAITDHAFKRPSTLVLEYGWSNSSLLTALAGAVVSGELPAFSFGAQQVRQIYEQLLALQNSRVPFSVVTGKRLYTNMLMEGLSTTTDAATENALLVTATCREIIIVSTQTTTVAPQANQAIPASTAGITNVGQVQPIPVTPSAANTSALRSVLGTFS